MSGKDVICPRCKLRYASAELPNLRCPNCEGIVSDLKSYMDSAAAGVLPVPRISPEKSNSTRNAAAGSRQNPSKKANAFLSESEVFTFNSEDLVKAQDRTTHAVRSLAVFFFMNLFWTAIVGTLVGIANLIPTETHCGLYEGCSSKQNGFAVFLLFIAVIAAIAGIIITIRVSVNELRSSRIRGTWM